MEEKASIQTTLASYCMQNADLISRVSLA